MPFKKAHIDSLKQKDAISIFLNLIYVKKNFWVKTKLYIGQLGLRENWL